MTRDQVIQLPSRARFPFEVESAALDEKTGKFRVTGLLNSFGVTHSRRMLHPAAYERWLSERGDGDLAMLAQHGYGGSTFASIGRWDQFARTPQGMRWGGWIGNSTDLQRETRALLQEGVLKALSVGWVTRQARYVTEKDADLDAHVRAALSSAKLSECYVIFDWYPVEGSVVDVGDDTAAALEAAAATPLSAAELLRGVGDLIAPLREALATLATERAVAISLSDEQLALLADTLAMTLTSNGYAADEPPGDWDAAGEAAHVSGCGAGRSSPSSDSPPAARAIVAESMQRLRALL